MNAPTGKIAAASPLVYQKIAAVQGELAKVGIAKSGRNQQQGYNFRGIDQVFAALSPLLAEHGLVIIPRMTERVVEERQARGGGALFNVTVRAEFDFIAAEDGSIHTASTYGEAMDSADKATNKAMSAAYKYTALMTFAIPTEGDNDADATTHEVAAKGSGRDNAGESKVSPPGASAPSEMPYAEWAKLVQLVEAVKPDTAAMLKHYGVKTLRHLNQGQYAEAVQKLTDRLAAMAKEETDKAATDFGKELADEIVY